MRRKLILIWTFPLTLLAAGILWSAIIFRPLDETDWGFSSMHMFVSAVMMFAVMGAGSFVSHVPVALALNKRLPADRLWLMILLSLAATAATHSLWELPILAPPAPSLPIQDSRISFFLLVVLLPGIVMSLIHVLVAFVPCSFLNRSNSPKTT